MKRFCVVLIALLILSGCAGRLADSTPPSADLPVPENLSTLPAAPLPAAPIERETLTLSIPAGATLPQIGMALEEMDVYTTRHFIEAAQSVAGNLTDFPLLAALPRDGRFFALEGYLFPGEYEIDPRHPPAAVVRQILENTQTQIDADLHAAIDASGYTLDEIIIIASIVQRESLNNDEAKPLVASVIHNRLNTGMMLQMCMTSFYVRDYIAPFYEGSPARFHDLYNTYIVPRLPAGPIGNPSLAAIHAALSPAQTDYFFYIWDNDDNFHFAAGWNEHQANVQRYLS
ncbi:MAG: endolytic transglycosylase MltG [Oscillospiraceae bacterium]|nr:endolytic transglycosylase MltG [Oscillospiraceae bacterium]